MNDTYLDDAGYYRYSDSDELVHRRTAYKHIYLENRSRYPLPFSAYVVHHKDGNKRNNAVWNLEILLQEEHEGKHGFNFPSINLSGVMKFCLIVSIVFGIFVWFQTKNFGYGATVTVITFIVMAIYSLVKSGER